MISSSLRYVILGAKMKRFTAVVLVLVFMALSTGFSMSSSLEDCGDYEHSVKWIKNIPIASDATIYSMTVDWPLIYTDCWGGLYVTDLSNPQTPEVILILEMQYGLLEKENEIGLVRFDQESLISLDFSDPFAPICRDTLDLDLPGYNYIRTINISGDRAYVGTMYQQLLVVDISDLSNLVVTGSWLSPEPINDVEIFDGVIYVGDWKSLHLLDISDPDNPHEIASKDSPRLHFNKNGNLMSAVNSHEFEVLRITNPAHPESILRAPAFYIENGAVSEDVVAVAFQSIEIYPLKQLAPTEQMVRVGNRQNLSGHLSIHEDFLIKTSGSIIELYELQQGRSVQGGPVNQLEYFISDLSHQDNLIYMATRDHGLQIYRFSAEGEAELVSSTDEFGPVKLLEVAGNRALVSKASTWQILDISNPQTPTSLTEPWPLPTEAEHIFLFQNQVVITGTQWVKVFDVSNLDDIQETFSTEIDNCSSAEMDGQTLYLGLGYDNPVVQTYSLIGGNLQLQATIALLCRAVDIAARDDVLLINNCSYAHQSYDVSDPSAPALITETETWSRGKAQILNDGILINDQFSLRFYNTDNYLDLNILGAFWHSDMNGFQMMADGRVLVWRDNNIQVVPAPCSWSQPQKQQPTNLQTIIKASPNPFNPQTTLMFTLPHSGFCSLDIYDLRGRLVQQLWSGNRQEGEQQFLWQGKDEEGQSVPSGIYFARLVHDGGVANQKIVLLK